MFKKNLLTMLKKYIQIIKIVTVEATLIVARVLDVDRNGTIQLSLIYCIFHTIEPHLRLLTYL
jgi:hypothetical protein